MIFYLRYAIFCLMPVRIARKSKKIAKRRKAGFSWKKSRAAKKIKRKIRILFFAVFCLIFSAFLLVSFSLYKFVKAPFASASFSSVARQSKWNQDTNINILFLEVDDLKKQSPILTKAAIINLNPQDKKYAIISIPVDTEIDLAQRYGLGSLSKAFVLGNLGDDKNGIVLVQKSIFKQLAVKTDSYVLVDEDGEESFKNIFREIDFGDIKHTTSAVSIYVNRSFYSFLQKSVKTDLSASELFAAISFIRGVDLANSKVYYLNEDTFSTQKFFDNFWKGVNTTTYDENSRVLVLNSAQVSGLAGWGGRVLENLGLTLLDASNSNTKHDVSFIVAKNVDSKIVSILSEVFGIKEIKSREEVEDSENAFERGDIVIVLGIDIADGL